MNSTPERQIRASYTDMTIRVYQAFSKTIADSALSAGTFRSPPFKMERMTWIKPSFLWMMYRSGWGQKDDNQSRILAIDISIVGFEWALEHSCLSHKPRDIDEAHWRKLKLEKPVRIQWDPERDVHLNPLNYRSIQIGLSNEAVEKYVGNWIKCITDVTDLSRNVNSLVQENKVDEAKSLLPEERTYLVSKSINSIIGAKI